MESKALECVQSTNHMSKQPAKEQPPNLQESGSPLAQGGYLVPRHNWGPLEAGSVGNTNSTNNVEDQRGEGTTQDKADR